MVNILGIIICAIFSIILGSIWYGPLFGKQWMKLSKIKKPSKITSAIKKMMIRSYSITLISSIITATIISVLLANASLIPAMITIFLIWLGFLATSMIGIVLWEGKPVKLYLLNVFYYLVSLEIMVVILYFI